MTALFNYPCPYVTLLLCIRASFRFSIERRFGRLQSSEFVQCASFISQIWIFTGFQCMRHSTYYQKCFCYWNNLRCFSVHAWVAATAPKSYFHISDRRACGDTLTRNIAISQKYAGSICCCLFCGFKWLFEGGLSAQDVQFKKAFLLDSIKMPIVFEINCYMIISNERWKIVLPFSRTLLINIEISTLKRSRHDLSHEVLHDKIGQGSSLSLIILSFSRLISQAILAAPSEDNLA